MSSEPPKKSRNLVRSTAENQAMFLSLVKGKCVREATTEKHETLTFGCSFSHNATSLSGWIRTSSPSQASARRKMVVSDTVIPNDVYVPAFAYDVGAVAGRTNLSRA